MGYRPTANAKVMVVALVVYADKLIVAVELQVKAITQFGFVAAVVSAPFGNKCVLEMGFDVGLYRFRNERSGYFGGFAIDFQQLAGFVEIDGASVVEPNLVFVVQQAFIQRDIGDLRSIEMGVNNRFSGFRDLFEGNQLFIGARRECLCKCK